jgi:serine protease Do
VQSPDGSPYSELDPSFRRFFGDRFREPRERREQGLGSGVIVSRDGYLLTNDHVVEKATDIRVVLPDKREFRAKLVGADPRTDIAVLKIDGETFEALPLGDSSAVRVGDIALAIGNPFGIGQTVTMGIISATGRGGLGIEDYEDFIQTDAAINPGNSGGALINTRGELIGINTAILSRGGGNQGVGFAVPVNMARQVMGHLRENGRVIRGYLGVSIQPLTPREARLLNLRDARGALVSDVIADGPASAAGLQRGDVVVGLNDQAVTDDRDLRLAKARHDCAGIQGPAEHPARRPGARSRGQAGRDAGRAASRRSNGRPKATPRWCLRKCSNASDRSPAPAAARDQRCGHYPGR